MRTSTAQQVREINKRKCYAVYILPQDYKNVKKKHSISSNMHLIQGHPTCFVKKFSELLYRVR